MHQFVINSTLKMRPFYMVSVLYFMGCCSQQAFCQYDVSITTSGVEKQSLIRQNYLSYDNAFPLQDRFVSFQVKGNGAAVYLESIDKSYTDKKVFYYIFIGAWNNQRSAILYVNDTFSSTNEYANHIVAVAYGTHLSSTSYTQFWLSWCGEEIMLGFGTEYDEELIVSWRNPSPFIVVDMAVASSYTCYWRFQSNDVVNGTARCPRNNMCNNCGRECQPNVQYTLYNRLTTCLEYKTIQSMTAVRHSCIGACSQDANCWAWMYAKENGTCTLLSGNVVQSYKNTKCYIKRQLLEN